MFPCDSLHAPHPLPPPSQAVSISLFSMSVSPLLLCKYIHQYHLSRFHIYVLVYDTFFSFWLTSLCTIGSRFIHFSVDDILSFSHLRLFVTQWTAAHQASPSFTISQSLLKLMSIESLMPSNHLILCLPFSCPQSFLALGSFPMSQFFASGSQSIGVSASASVLPMNIQDWFPLGWTDLNSLLSKGLSRVFSSTTVRDSLKSWKL